MLGSPQILRVPNTQIECISFQTLCTGLSKRRRLGMLDLRHFFWSTVYVMGSVDNTLITLNHDTDVLLVQIYVDDIIFCSSSHTLMSRFQKMMESEFQMSMI
jgi:hypothetical protein